MEFLKDILMGGQLYCGVTVALIALAIRKKISGYFSGSLMFAASVMLGTFFLVDPELRSSREANFLTLNVPAGHVAIVSVQNMHGETGRMLRAYQGPDLVLINKAQDPFITVVNGERAGLIEYCNAHAIMTTVNTSPVTTYPLPGWNCDWLNPPKTS